MNPLIKFMDAIHKELGNTPAELPEGVIVRFDEPTAKAGNKNLWAVLSLATDNPFGAYGSWREGTSFTWSNNSSGQNKLTPYQQREIKEQRLIAQRQRALETAARNQAIAAKALSIWNKAVPANPNHPYIQAKKLFSAGLARQSRDCLILPMMTFDGEIKNLQFIYPNGDKRPLAGGQKQHCFIPVHLPSKPLSTFICEGWSTGQTLADYHPRRRVIAAIDAGNLNNVALAAANRWNEPIVICGDDDRTNTENRGKAVALAAAASIGASVCFPEFPSHEPLSLSDFNDWSVFTQQGGGNHAN